MASLRDLPARVNRRLTRRLPLKTVRSRLERPLASISFDDFPRSAWTTAGAILERRGVKATYFVAGGLCGRTMDGQEQFTAADLAEVRDAGHELGCHSFNHRPAPKVATAELDRESAENAAFLGVEGAARAPVSFAYPYGEASPRTKAWCAGRYAVGRGIAAGVNGRSIDLAELKASPLEARSWSEARMDAWVRETVATNGWLVLFTHDVSDAPSPFGATPAMLEYALDSLARAGVGIRPIRSVLPEVVFGRS